MHSFIFLEQILLYVYVPGAELYEILEVNKK